MVSLENLPNPWKRNLRQFCTIPSRKREEGTPADLSREASVALAPKPVTPIRRPEPGSCLRSAAHTKSSTKSYRESSHIWKELPPTSERGLLQASRGVLAHVNQCDPLNRWVKKKNPRVTVIGAEQVFNSSTLIHDKHNKLRVEGNFLSLMKSFHKIHTASTIIGGGKNECFPSQTGKVQGCPLSPLIVSVVLEVPASDRSDQRESKTGPNCRWHDCPPRTIPLTLQKDQALITGLNSIAGYEIGTQRSVIFLHTKQEQVENKTWNTVSFTVPSKTWHT